MPDASDLDPLERLESRLGQLQEALDRHRLGDALDAAVLATNEAEPTISRLEQLAGFTALVGDVLEQSDSKHCHLLLTEIRNVGQYLSQSSEPATLRDAASQASQLNGRVVQIDSLVRRGWKAKVDQAFAATGRLGGILQEISETRQLGSEMEALARRADRLAALVEDAERAAAGFVALTTEQGSTKGRLADLDAGPEVVDFLLAVSERSATLATVTEDVKDWLYKRNALERFKVVL